MDPDAPGAKVSATDVASHLQPTNQGFEVCHGQGFQHLEFPAKERLTVRGGGILPTPPQPVPRAWRRPACPAAMLLHPKVEQQPVPYFTTSALHCSGGLPFLSFSTSWLS